jgi:dihydrofolate reductase
MTRVRAQISISLDGFVAGPNQSLDNPLGVGGTRLHEWVVATDSFHRLHGREAGEHNADSEVIDELYGGIGAYIMGRNMIAGRGEWDESWRGWWGEDPPFHVPVFVLTHHPREPLEMQGGTTFHFVTDGIESALDQAPRSSRSRSSPRRRSRTSGTASRGAERHS